MQPLLSLLMSQNVTVVQAGNCAKDDYGHTGDLPLPQLWYVQRVFTALLCTTEQDTKVLSFWPLYNCFISIVTPCRGVNATEDTKFRYKSIGTVCKIDQVI